VTVGREPSARGVLTRFRQWPPAGGERCVPSGPRGRFQPAPAAPVEPRRWIFVPMFQGTRPDPSRGRPESHDQHFPLDHPRRAFGRQLKRPPPRRGKEKYGSGFQGDASILDRLVGGGGKVLILLGSCELIPMHGRELALMAIDKRHCESPLTTLSGPSALLVWLQRPQVERSEGFEVA
jgi:hypothetical protein